MTVREATCACGQLSASCRGDPVLVSLCHCLQCQKRTGSAFGVAAFYMRSDVEIAGDHSDLSRPADSGRPITFHFCAECGGTVFWEPARKPDFVAVAVGAFADPNFPAPTQAAFTERSHAWVGIAI
jgi:hypothetical protein